MKRLLLKSTISKKFFADLPKTVDFTNFIGADFKYASRICVSRRNFIQGVTQRSART